MRIVFLGTRGFPNVQGGVEKHCENLTPLLVELGHEVIVFTRKPYVNPDLKNYRGVQLIALPSIKHKTLEAFLHTFLGLIVTLKYKPDIIHFQSIGPGSFAFLGRLLSGKIVLTTHGSNYEHMKWNKIEKKILKFFEGIAMHWSHEIIAISKPIGEKIKKEYGRTPFIIPNGVQIISPVDSCSKLNELGLSKGKYILTVGRLVPEKGYHDLTQAFLELGLPKWKLVIVGASDHESEYSRNLIHNSLINPNILFTGFLSGIQLYELYSHAGLFVLPSYYEGLPISLLEAMSFGLTCIVSDIPGNRNVGLSESHYFEVGNVNALKKVIQEFVRCQNTEVESKAQIEMIKTNYDWRNVAKMTDQVYRNMAKRKC
jgi:glycosyltransferase involved in cell wall biosynthesis